MFGFFDSQERKMRENAANWLELADKVWHFRRDRLTDREASELRQRTDELNQRLKAKAESAQLKLSIDSLETVLRRTGGAIYPKTALVENVEFFLVAAIVIIGIRTYFVQPFKIPTNSMWPTYNGMTAEVFARPADEPGPLAVAARAVAFGAWPHRLDAPAEGEVLIPVYGANNRGLVHSHTVPGRSWLVFPTQLREYTLLVGDRPVTVRLPYDFDFDWVVADAFFPSPQGYSSQEFIARLNAKLLTRDFEEHDVDGMRVPCIRTGRFVKAGERILSFDELTGDQLFVDRLSYNFVQPRVGQGFVFRTANIPEISRYHEPTYYIKHLVGVPGDTLQIKEPVLWRNGSPITGADAFQHNANQEDRYRGYFYGPVGRAHYLLTPDEKLVVPERSFFAMGDNSGNSEDGRYWGFVPAKEVIGRPLFIYFPFTRHWGPAR